MADYTVRNFNPETDYPGVKDNLTRAGLFDGDYESPDRLARWLAIQDDAIIVATSGETVIGNVYFQDGIIPIFFRLAVSGRFRGEGVGSALLNEAEQRAILRGHTHAELYVSIRNAEVQDWCERRGYKSSGSYFNMFKDLRSKSSAG